MLNHGWLHHTPLSKELLNLNHKEPDSTLETDHPQAAAATMPTQDSSLAMELLMLDLPANILPTRSSTHAPEEVPEIKTQTTEFLVVTLEISFWELLVDLLPLLLLMRLLEVLVEDKIQIFFGKSLSLIVTNC